MFASLHTSPFATSNAVAPDEDESLDDFELVGTGSSKGANVEDSVMMSDEDVKFFRETFECDERPCFREFCYFDAIGNGWLYLSRKHLCFSGGMILRSKKKLSFALDIENVVRERSMLGSSAIVLKLFSGKSFRVSSLPPFGQAFSNLYNVVLRMWKKSMEQAVTLAEQNEHSDVVDLVLKRANASSAKDSQDGADHKRRKDVAEYNSVIRTDTFELVEAVRKQVAFVLEGEVVHGTLFVGPVLAFVSESGTLSLACSVLDVSSVVSEERSNKIELKLMDEDLVLEFVHVGIGSVMQDLLLVLKGVWKSEYNKLLTYSSRLSPSTSPAACHCPSFFGGEMLNDPKEFSADYPNWNDDRVKEWKKYGLRYGRGSRGNALKRVAFYENGKRFGAPFIVLKDEWRRLVQEGIPDEFRGEVWQQMSGSALERTSRAGYYTSLTGMLAKRTFAAGREISKDVGRTLPSHPYYQTEAGIQALERVLGCYALYNPRIGYTQSMNFACAVFLLYMSEEDAFWMMVALCERLAPNVYRKSMVGSVAQVETLGVLFKQEFPALSARLEDLGFGVGMVSTGWMMCLFISFLPWEICLRILDNYFCLSSKFPYRVALALFMCNEDRLKACDALEDAIAVFQRREYLAEELLSVAYCAFPHLQDEEIERLELEQTTKASRAWVLQGEEALLSSLKGKTKFSEDETRKMYERFKDFLKNSAVGAFEFQEFLQALSFFVPLWSNNDELVMLTFKRFDRNVRGIIEFEDFLVILSVLLRGDATERLEFCLRLYGDVSGDAIPSSSIPSAVSGFLSLFDCKRLSHEDVDAMCGALKPPYDVLLIAPQILSLLADRGIAFDAVDSEIGSFQLC